MQVIKEKCGNLDFIKIKNPGAARDIIKQRKGESTEQEKIFANHGFDKGSVSSIYKELLTTQ